MWSRKAAGDLQYLKESQVFIMFFLLSNVFSLIPSFLCPSAQVLHLFFMQSFTALSLKQVVSCSCFRITSLRPSVTALAYQISGGKKYLTSLASRISFSFCFFKVFLTLLNMHDSVDDFTQPSPKTLWWRSVFHLTANLDGPSSDESPWGPSPCLVMQGSSLLLWVCRHMLAPW